MSARSRPRSWPWRSDAGRRASSGIEVTGGIQALGPMASRSSALSPCRRRRPRPASSGCSGSDTGRRLARAGCPWLRRRRGPMVAMCLVLIHGRHQRAPESASAIGEVLGGDRALMIRCRRAEVLGRSSPVARSSGAMFHRRGRTSQRWDDAQVAPELPAAPAQPLPLQETRRRQRNRPKDHRPRVEANRRSAPGVTASSPVARFSMRTRSARRRVKSIAEREKRRRNVRCWCCDAHGSGSRSRRSPRPDSRGVAADAAIATSPVWRSRAGEHAADGPR